MKTAVITGSVKGIGKSIGIKLLEKGCFVFFNYSSDDDAAERLQKELDDKFPKNYRILRADLCDIEHVENFVRDCVVMTDTIDYLILNAGCTDRTPPLEITVERWNRVMDVNLNMPFFLVQKFSRYLRNSTGSVLFTGSVMGCEPHGTSIVYGVSKASVHFLVRCLMKTFAERGITVNAICPGFTDTPWQEDKSCSQRKRIEEKTALNRFARPEEIAEMMYAILCNSYINGAVVRIDGGYNYQ